MPAPDRDMRSMIGYAAARLNVGMSAERVAAAIDQEFRGEPEARKEEALRNAQSYYRSAAAIRAAQRARRGTNIAPFAIPLAQFFEEQPTEGQLVSVRVYFTGKLENGDQTQGSIVLNVDPTASTSLILQRAVAAICGGHIGGPNQKYRCQEMRAEIQSVAPYERGNAPTLDVRKVTRETGPIYPQSE